MHQDKDTDIHTKIRSILLLKLENRPFTRISFKEISDECGMTRQNLYRYYTSKEEILIDSIERSFSDIFDHIDANSSTSEDSFIIDLDVVYEGLKKIEIWH